MAELLKRLNQTAPLRRRTFCSARPHLEFGEPRTSAIYSFPLCATLAQRLGADINLTNNAHKVTQGSFDTVDEALLGSSVTDY